MDVLCFVAALSVRAISHLSNNEHGVYDSYAVDDEPSVPKLGGNKKQSPVVHRSGESIGMAFQPIFDRTTGLAGETIALKRDLSE